MVDIALKLEGTNRNVGTHAAGVVIANGPITDYVPVQRVVRKGDDDEARARATIASRRSGKWAIIEKVGMLKMDFLGLRNLTVLDNCVKLIKKTRGARRSTRATFPLDDTETYKLLQRGDAKGVFQLESEGIRELLKRMKPDNIRDLIAVLALYRPGPLEGGMVDEYIECKHGRKKPDVPAPDHGGGAERDVRRDGVPGAGHADPEPHRRHRAGEGVRVHQGDQQEEVRDHQRAEGRLRRRGASERGMARRRPPRSSS